MESNSLYLTQGIFINIFQIINIVSVFQYFRTLSIHFSKKKKKPSSKLNKKALGFNFLFLYFIISAIEIGLLLYVLFSTEILNKNQQNLPINTLFYSYLVYFSVKFLTTFLDKSSQYSVLQTKHNSFIFSIKVIKFIKTIFHTLLISIFNYKRKYSNVKKGKHDITNCDSRFYFYSFRIIVLYRSSISYKIFCIFERKKKKNL